MKEIAVLIAIYITIVSAITEDVEDYRFTKENGRQFSGTFVEGKNLRFVSYYRSPDNKTSYQTVADLQRTCGPYERKFEVLKHGGRYYFVNVQPLNKDKVLVYPYFNGDGTGINLFANDMEIVDLSACKVSKLSLPNSSEQQTKFKKLVGIRTDSFVLALHDPELYGGTIFKQTYDFEGKQISAPVLTTYGPHMPVPQVQFVGSESKSDGEVVISRMNGVLTGFLVKDRPKKLQEFSEAFSYPGVTTTNNFITFGDQLDSKRINVTRFDLDGNFEFKTVLSFEYDIRQTYFLNAPNKSSYFVASDCREPFCKQENEKHYLVKKIDATGNEIGSLVIEIPSTTDSISQVKFYKNNESYCISRLQESPEELFIKVKIVTKCFDDSDFSK